MNANAAKYLTEGSLIIGITDKKIATNNAKIGMTIGTLYGRGTSGWVLRKTRRATKADPYATQIKNEANSMSASMSPTTMNKSVIIPLKIMKNKNTFRNVSYVVAL